MLFSRKKSVEVVEVDVLDQKLEGLVRYAHIYAGFFYIKLSKQFPNFKSAVNDYSNAFMELYTIAALSVSLHSPIIARYNLYDQVHKAIKRQLDNYFSSSKNDLYSEVISCSDFYTNNSIELVKLGYNFPEFPAYWLLQKLSVYKEFFNDYDLLSELGNELTNHYIYAFEDTWEPREFNASEILNKN